MPRRKAKESLRTKAVIDFFISKKKVESNELLNRQMELVEFSTVACLKKGTNPILLFVFYYYP